MQKLLLSILLLVFSCEEIGLNTEQISNGTAVADTLYISNYDTLIITNYDTTIVNSYDTLIITNYDTTFVFDTLIVLDTLIINNTDCAGVEGGMSILDCFSVCSGEAAIDSCGVCTGGTTELEINYLMDCAGICNGDAVLDHCGTCDADETNNCFKKYECVDNNNISLELNIYPMNLYYLSDWQTGTNKLAELVIINTNQNSLDDVNFYLYYYAKINNEIVIEGQTHRSYLYPTEIRYLSNTNFNPYSIQTHHIDYSFFNDLSTYGHLLTGNYEIGIQVINPYGYQETYCSILLDSLYQIP